MNRRTFLRTAGGTVGVSTAATGPVRAQANGTGGGNQTAGGNTTGGGGNATGGGGNATGGGNQTGGGNETGGAGGGGGGEPDLGGYLDDVSNFDGTIQDFRGQGQATVQVGASGNGGNFAFSPPAVHVDNGATVIWEWTGQGGEHNVVHEGGDFESELSGESGFTFEHTFDEDGVYQYFCQPHKSLGMKGVVVVGTDFPTAGAGGVQPLEPHEFGVPFQPHFVGAVTFLGIFLSLVFTFFVLKYGESSHAKGGRD